VSATPSPIYDFLRDVWTRTQSAAVVRWLATDLATHPSVLEISQCVQKLQISFLFVDSQIFIIFQLLPVHQLNPTA
jgi:hypothetical protein